MKFINKNEFVLDDFKIDPATFLEVRLEQPKPVILDIRPLSESESGTFIGAHKLPADTLEDRLIQLPPFGTIVLYSDGENRNVEECVRLLWENGFTEVLFVDGGLEGILKTMVSVDEDFLGKLDEFSKDYEINGKPRFKIRISGYDYEILPFESPEEVGECFEIHWEKFSLYFEPKVFRLLDQTTVSVSGGLPSVHNPRMDMERPSGSVRERIQKVLDEMINPGIAMHGGFVNLLDVDGDVAYIEMGGGCQGCGMSQVTLKHGIESTIFDHIPEITEVLDRTDHSSGTNPYYRPEY